MLLMTAFALAAVQPAQPAPKADVPGFGLPADKKTYLPVHTLLSEAVQKELKFTDEQTTAATTIQADLERQVAAADKLPTAAQVRAYTELAKKTDQAVDALLKADQKRRFREIVWQVIEHATGPLAMANNPAFAKELGLTDAQKRTAAKIVKDREAAILAAKKGPRDPGGVGGNPGGAGGNPGGAGVAKLTPQQLEEIREKHDALLMAALTDGQKRKWDEVTGQPFLHKIEMPGGGAFAPPVPKK